MVFLIKTDIVAMLRHLVEAIRPFARSNFVDLAFRSEVGTLNLPFHPELLIPDLTKILCRVISFTPSNYAVSMSLDVLHHAGEQFLRIRIANTGVRLDHFTALLTEVNYKVQVTALGDRGTVFELRLRIAPKSTGGETLIDDSTAKAEYDIPVFFEKLRKNMQVYTVHLKDLEEAVARKRSQRDQVFLKKVDAIISAKLDQEGFDVAALSRALATSRTQLYRRLKYLIHLTPSQYIRYIRLQKAREYLENSDRTVGEVSFSVGFLDKSHFTRAFKKQYGFNPSCLRKKPKDKAQSHEQRKEK